MKSTIISMLLVLVVMVALPMVFLGEDNFAQRLGFSGFGSGGGTATKPKLPENVKPVVTNKRVEVYTWIDEHGVKQFSNTPPRDGGESEKMVLSPDTNVIDGLKIPEQEAEVASGPKVFNVGNPYTPGGIKEVIDNTKDVSETLNQRQAEQEQFMDKLFNKK